MTRSGTAAAGSSSTSATKTHELTEDELEQIADRLEWSKSPESRMMQHERRVKRMLADGTFRGFGKLEHVVEYDGAKTWRTRNATDVKGDDPG